MGQSLPDRGSMAAGNCTGKELEDQSSSAWGAVKRFAQWVHRASIRARNSLRFLGGGVPSRRDFHTLRIFHSSGRNIRGHLLPCSGRDSTTQCPVRGRHERAV